MIPFSPFLSRSTWPLRSNNTVFWSRFSPPALVQRTMSPPIQGSVSQIPYLILEWLVHNIFYVWSEIQRMSYQAFKTESHLSVLALSLTRFYALSASPRPLQDVSQCHSFVLTTHSTVGCLEIPEKVNFSGSVPKQRGCYCRQRALRLSWSGPYGLAFHLRQAS